MNWYTLYFINVDTQVICAQRRCEKNAIAAVRNWRRRLRYMEMVEKGERYYIEICNGKRPLESSAIPVGFWERAQKDCKIAR